MIRNRVTNPRWQFRPKFQRGDEVCYEYAPKECRFITILDIEYLPYPVVHPDNIVRIVTMEGERIECRLEELL